MPSPLPDPKNTTPSNPCNDNLPCADPATADELEAMLADLDLEASAGTETFEEVIEKMTQAALAELEAEPDESPIAATPAPAAPDTNDIDAMLCDLDMAPDASAEPSVISDLDTGKPSTAPAIEPTITSAAPTPSKNVAATPSKNVAATPSKNVARSSGRNVAASALNQAAKDQQILQKISAFDPGPAPHVLIAPAPHVPTPLGVSSLVRLPTPLLTTPKSALRTPSPSPSNDNLIPVWSLTGERVKIVCATGALLIGDTAPVAFTFNLTWDAIEKAKADRDGFLDSLKRSFDDKLRRAGMVLLYWIRVDIDEDGRLHLHGAFAPPSAMSIRNTRKLRELMKDAWGHWIGPGKRKQLRFKRLYSDGWAIYSMKKQREVEKIIGPRTVTITQPLGREAKWVYEEVRRMMREGYDLDRAA